MGTGHSSLTPRISSTRIARLRSRRRSATPGTRPMLCIWYQDALFWAKSASGQTRCFQVHTHPLSHIRPFDSASWQDIPPPPVPPLTQRSSHLGLPRPPEESTATCVRRDIVWLLLLRILFEMEKGRRRLIRRVAGGVDPSCLRCCSMSSTHRTSLMHTHLLLRWKLMTIDLSHRMVCFTPSCWCLRQSGYS